MEQFPESFTPDKYTNQDELVLNKLRKIIFDTVSTSALQVHNVNIDTFDIKLVSKVKTELEEKGWMAKISEFTHLNRTIRSLKIANPIMGRRQPEKYDAFAPFKSKLTNSNPKTTSGFMKQNIGGSANKKKEFF